MDYSSINFYPNFFSSSVWVAPHCFVRAHGRGYLIFWGQKEKNLIFRIRRTSDETWLFEQFYQKKMLNSARYFRRLLCYPSFIKFLEGAGIEPRSVSVERVSV